MSTPSVSPPRISADERRDQIAKHFAYADYSMQQIADHFGVTRACINLDFRRLGIPYERCSTMRRKRARIADAMRLREQGRSFEEIKEWTGISDRVLKAAFAKAGRPTPPHQRQKVRPDVLDRMETIKDWMSQPVETRISAAQLARQLGVSKATLAAYRKRIYSLGPLRAFEITPAEMAIWRRIAAWLEEPSHARTPADQVMADVDLRPFTFEAKLQRVELLRRRVKPEVWAVLMTGTDEDLARLKAEWKAKAKKH